MSNKTLVEKEFATMVQIRAALIVPFRVTVMGFI